MFVDFTIKINAKTNASLSSSAKTEVKGKKVDSIGDIMTTIKGATLNLN